MSTTSSAADDPKTVKPQRTLGQQASVVLITPAVLFLLSWSYPPIWFRDVITFGPIAWAPACYLLYRRGLKRKILWCGAVAAFVAALVAAFRVVDLHLVDHARALLFSALVAGLMLASLWLRRRNVSLREESKAKQTPKMVFTVFVIVALFGGVYGYSLFGLLNEQFDAGPPRVLQAPVVSKYASRTRGISTYQVTLESDHGGRPKQYSVSSSAYQGLTVGRLACVNLHSGALGAHWLSVEPCA